MSRCWAFHSAHGRCALDAGHDSPHEVAHTWDDEECVDPSLVLTTTTGGRDVPIIETRAIPAVAVQPPSNTCYSCGCSEEAHSGGGCAKHQCKHFVA